MARKDEHVIPNVERTQDHQHHGETLANPLQNERQEGETRDCGHSLRAAEVDQRLPSLTAPTSWEACGSWAQAETETTSDYSSLLYANCSLRQQESAKAKDRPEPTP